MRRSAVPAQEAIGECPHRAGVPTLVGGLALVLPVVLAAALGRYGRGWSGPARGGTRSGRLRATRRPLDAIPCPVPRTGRLVDGGRGTALLGAGDAADGGRSLPGAELIGACRRVDVPTRIVRPRPVAPGHRVLVIAVLVIAALVAVPVVAVPVVTLTGFAQPEIVGARRRVGAGRARMGVLPCTGLGRPRGVVVGRPRGRCGGGPVPAVVAPGLVPAFRVLVRVRAGRSAGGALPVASDVVPPLGRLAAAVPFVVGPVGGYAEVIGPRPGVGGGGVPVA